MIDDIYCTPLPQICVDGGDVYHVLKKSDPSFESFGEVYVSFVDYNFVKCWKRHLKMTMNLIVPRGLVEFQFTNDFSTFKSFVIGHSHYCRLTVPPKIWFGFKGLHEPSSLIINIANIEHDPIECERLPLESHNNPWTQQ